MKKLIYLVRCFTLAITLMLFNNISAQTVNATYTEGTGTAPTVSNSDLLQNYATLTSQSGSFTNEGTTGPTILTDGIATFNSTGKSGIGSGSSLTYTFTSSPTGTEVTGVDIYSVWADGGRLTPNVTVSYSLITAPNDYIVLTTANFNPSVTWGNCWTKSSLAITGLTGLAAIKFDFPSQQNGFVGYNEIDVFGDAHISDTQAPTAPTSLSTLAVTDNTVVLGWNASTDDVGVLGYNIYKDGTLCGYTASTSYAVTGLTASTQYSFMVKAKDASNKISDASNTLVATTSTQPNYSITYTEGTGTAPTVSNTDLLQDFASLTAQSGTFTNEGTSDPSVLADGVASFGGAGKSGIATGSSLTYTFTNSAAGTDVTGVDIYSVWGDAGRLTPKVTISYSLKSAPGDFIAITTANFNPTVAFGNCWTKSSMTITGLTGLAAIKFDFPSQQNGYVGYTEIDVFGNPHVVDEQAPTAPANLNNLVTTDVSTVLAWDASTDNVGVIGYNIYKDGTLLGTSSSTSYVVSGLTASTQYSFTVKAKDAINNLSDASNTLVVSTTATPNYSITYTEGQGVPTAVSSSDLLQSNATLTAASGSFIEESTGDNATLTNGNALFGGANRAGISSGSSLTYTFAGSTTGFSISQINIYTTWHWNGRTKPNVSISYALKSFPNLFIPLATATFDPTLGSDANGLWTKSSVALTNVDGVGAIKFDFPNQSYNYVGYNEIDVIGATTPVLVETTKNISNLTLNASSEVLVKSAAELVVDNNTSINSITVQPGGKVTLGNSKALTATTLTLKSSASGTATIIDNGGTLTTTATVEQYLPQGRNWYISTPVSNGNTSGVVGAGTATSVSYYSEELGWQNNHSGALMPGIGYVAVSNSGTGNNNVAFSGTLNTGDVSVTLTRKSTGSFAGYNLIANPYPSYVNPMSAINANGNLVKTIWFRTCQANNTYKFETVNTLSGVGTNNAGTGTVTGYVPPMQAFWIRTNADNQTLTFTNSMRTHANPVDGATTISTTPLKAKNGVSQSLARLKVQCETGSDEAVVYFNSNASDAYDGYDSPKMFEKSSVVLPEIYTLAGTEKLVINGLNSIQYGAEIPVGFTAKQAGNYSIEVSDFVNFESGVRAVIKDYNLMTETELVPGSAYNFNVSSLTATTSRFTLSFRSPGVTTGLNKPTNTSNVYVNSENKIIIDAPLNSEYFICNSLGQKVNSGLLTENVKAINTVTKSGVYLVNVTVNGVQNCSRVVLK